EPTRHSGPSARGAPSAVDNFWRRVAWLRWFARAASGLLAVGRFTCAGAQVNWRSAGEPLQHRAGIRVAAARDVFSGAMDPFHSCKHFETMCATASGGTHPTAAGPPAATAH